MMNNRLFHSFINTPLINTYIVYDLIGYLIFIALISLIILLIILYCYIYYYFCHYHHHRYLSYELNEEFPEQESIKNNSFIKCHSDDKNHLSQLYNSYPHLISHSPIITTTTEINNQNCTTINTLSSSTTSHSSLIRSDSIVENNQNKLYKTIRKINRMQDYIKTPTDRILMSGRLSSCNLSILSKQILSSENDNNQKNCQTIIPNTTICSSLEQLTPIYETEWTHNLTQVTMNKIPSMEFPLLSSPGLISTTDYFQQEHPYNKFLVSRQKSSDSIRRTKILKRLKDDASFLY
ncbi:unnamed protein product [Adineta steineri]|uniref:Uncharacterized protein n=1 Tax=Adineta steineri TaxID=433720 RepID=A0A819H8L7_9BILA|nr:unnamed protein product [Adineta steineri]CAF3775739.1 unnamed protein product [Adineta steineri]CAF3895937.1 unnamed protein product [Adineta steineri]